MPSLPAASCNADALASSRGERGAQVYAGGRAPRPGLCHVDARTAEPWLCNAPAGLFRPGLYPDMLLAAVINIIVTVVMQNAAPAPPVNVAEIHVSFAAVAGPCYRAHGWEVYGRAA